MADSSSEQGRMGRRALLRNALGLGAASLLAACGGAPAAPAGNTDAGATPAAGDTAAPAASSGKAAEITWYMNIDQTRNTWAEKVIIPAFAKVQPEIKVNLMTVPWDDFDSKLLSLAAAGTPPDVFSQWGQSGGGTYYHKNLLLPLDDLAKSAKWDLSHIPESLQKAYSFDGQLFGVPMYSLGSFIYYNKKVFDEKGVPPPPLDWNDQSWTWDELVARAQKLTSDYGDPQKGRYGIAVGLNDLYVGIPWLFGAQPFPDEAYSSGKISKVNFTSDAMIAAVQAKADLVNKHKVSPTQAISDAISQAGNPLATGRVAMQLQGGWGIWELKELKDVEWGVGAVPRQKANTIPTFSDPWYVSKGSKNPEAAFQLVMYLTTGAGQQSIAKDLAAPPADQTLLQDWYRNFPQLKPDDLSKVYTGAIKVSRETPSSLLYGYGPVEDAYNQTTAPIWTGEKTAAEVLPEAEKRANEALKGL